MRWVFFNSIKLTICFFFTCCRNNYFIFRLFDFIVLVCLFVHILHLSCLQFFCFKRKLEAYSSCISFKKNTKNRLYGYFLCLFVFVVIRVHSFLPGTFCLIFLHTSRTYFTKTVDHVVYLNAHITSLVLSMQNKLSIKHKHNINKNQNTTSFKSHVI